MTTANNTTVKATVKALVTATLGCIKGAAAIGIELAPLAESTLYLVAGGIRVLKEELSIQDIHSIETAAELIRNWLEDAEDSEEAKDLATQIAELEANLEALKNQQSSN